MTSGTTFEVEIDGRVRAVTIDSVGAADPRGGAFRVTVHDPRDPHGPAGAQAPAGGAAEIVECRQTDLGWLLAFPDGRTVEISTTEQPGGDWLLQLPRVDVTAAVDRRRRERGRGGVAAASGVQRVMAPMPGRVVRVLVKPGDEVALRQGLVVVEAMKMENELTSPKAGRVKEVAVAEGVSVEAGRLLIVVE